MSLAERHPELASKYELIAERGQGGMGQVLRARHRQLKRDVAIKLLHRDLKARQISGGTAVVSAAGLWLLWPRTKESPERASLNMAVGPERFDAVWTGRF